MVFGDKEYFTEHFFDAQSAASGFAGVFEAQDRMKGKRPAELAVALLTKLDSAWDSAAGTLAAAAANPASIQAFIDQYRLVPTFMTDIIGYGAHMFMLSISQHILGDDIDVFVDRYNANIRQFYHKLVFHAVKRAIGNQATPTMYLSQRRLSDVTVALILKSRELAENMAKEFLVRVGYSGDSIMMPATLRTAFESVYATWHAHAVTLVSDLMKPGVLMQLVTAAEDYYDRVTVYRRPTAGTPRMTFSFTRNGEQMDWKVRYRDHSPYIPVTDRHAAGYLNMAYQIDGVHLSPIVDSDDINELMLDLTLPANEQSVEVDVNASQLPPVLALNPGIIFRTEHVARYLADEGFNATTEIAGFLLEIPKGSTKEIFSLTDTALPVGTNTAETLTILSHPEVYTSCVMKLLGETYTLAGLAAKEYARYYATQVLGALVPYTADSGKITITSSDLLRAPRRVAELPDFIGPNRTHFLDKTFIRRFATTYLNVNENVLDDGDIALLGKDLLRYYLHVLHLLGFEMIAAKLRTAMALSVEDRSAVDALPMVMTWGNSTMWVNRLKPFGLSSADHDVRYRLALLQVYLSKITNDKVLKALLQAMSIYIAYDTTDLSVGSIEGIWKGTLTTSLLGN